jgi:SulP family sulfate permease
LLNFIETLENIGSANFTSLVVFAIALAMLLAFKRYVKAVPGILPVSVIGIVIGRGAKSGWIPREMLTLSDQFPDLTFQLIAPNYIGNTLVTFWSQLELVNEIAFAAFAIAIVGILETIISAKIADKMTKTKFHQQKEVFGLAMANLASGLA